MDHSASQTSDLCHGIESKGNQVPHEFQDREQKFPFLQQGRLVVSCLRGLDGDHPFFHQILVKQALNIVQGHKVGVIGFLVEGLRPVSWSCYILNRVPEPGVLEGSDGLLWGTIHIKIQQQVAKGSSQGPTCFCQEGE